MPLVITLLFLGFARTDYILSRTDIVLFINEFHNIVQRTIKGFALAFVEPGKTLLIWIAFAVPVLCFLLLPTEVVIYIGWVFILFAVSAPAYFAARSQVKVFARFGGPAARIEPQEDNFYQ